MEFVGKFVKKSLKGIGVVQSYDASSGFFMIAYDDGDSEELRVSEVFELVVDAPIGYKTRVDRRPKKRCRVNRGNEAGVAESGTSNPIGETLGTRLDNNGGLGIFRNVDLNDGLVGNLKEIEGVERNIDVDLNRVVENGDAGSKGVLDLNAGFNLNLNEGFDLNEEGGLNDSVRGESKKRGYIDLNLNVDGDAEDSFEEVPLVGKVVEAQKREPKFDLNLVIDDESRDDIGCDDEGKVKQSASFMVVKEDMEKTEEPRKVVVGTQDEGTSTSGTLEEVHDTKGSCIGTPKGIQRDETISGQDARAYESLEMLDAKAIKQDSDLISGKQGYIKSGISGASGSRRGRRRGRKPADNLNSMSEGMISTGANSVKGDCGMVTDNIQDDRGSAQSEIHPKRRKRRKFLDDISYTPEMTVLRRSARRGSARSNVLASAPSVVANDLSVSAPFSAVSEEDPDTLQHGRFDELLVLPVKVQLPPSSRNLDLDGTPVLDIFAIYACLRSFSTLLFLSPFELEDFVAALKCNSPSLLFDSIHVAILQTLRKHLEQLSHEGSESASDCLRSLNWGLLDLITWPAFMVEYLLIHGSGLKPGFDLSCMELLKTNYYEQPAYVKVEILRCLCDNMIEVEIIRSELSRRSSVAECELDFDRYVKRRAGMDLSGSSCLTEEGADDTTDWNSDECYLCKMDGNLICCDGCPAAYHSKCVGVVSDSLPEGDWYCPECAVDRHQPWMTPRKSLRGAELLGVDPFGRLFFSSCDYLLVSDSCEGEASFNFYNKEDLNVVVEVLKSSEMHYRGILGAIQKHWGMAVSLYGATRTLGSANFTLGPEMCIAAPTAVSAETHAVNNGTIKDRRLQEEYGSGSANLHCAAEPACLSLDRFAETTHMLTRNQSSQNDKTDFSNISADLKKCEVQGRFIASNSLDNNKRDNSESATSGYTASSINIANGEAKLVQPGAGYKNYYSFGHMASLVVEELMRKSSDRKSEDSIKSGEEIISAQMKVISKKNANFYWPNILETNKNFQTEKCGWCFSCRFSGDDSDCLFNISYGPTKEASLCQVGGLQIKRSIGHLNVVTSYILSMEDRLQGLLLGPWLNPHFTQVWRKGALKESDIESLKQLVLMLESNLHHLAFTAEWSKHVDSSVTLGSASHIVTASLCASSKSGFGRKRARYSELEANNSSSSEGGLTMFWWRGGRLSRQLFNWKALPRSIVSKAARQAGCTKIPGILYPENSDFARRTKNLTWRAAVESLKNVEQLALQVRELDLNIKWDEIENTRFLSMLDKEFRRSFRLFKKTIVRRKCLEGEGSKYLLDFGKRKTIPEVVLKYGSLVEESSSDRKKYWLSESHVPLHLLKSFEEKRIARKSGKVLSAKPNDGGLVLRKPSNKRGFAYLFAKAERSEYHKCGHCKKDVPIREAVSCQYCKGFFHKRHVRKSPGSFTANCIYTCHRCLNGKYVKIVKRTGKSGLKRDRNNKKNVKVLQQKSTKITVSSKSKRVKSKQKALKVSRPLRSQNNKKAVIVVPLRRSARQAKYRSLQNKKLRGRKKGKQVKSIKGTPSKPKKVVSWQKKRTHAYHSYWHNGLLLSRKPDDERILHFRRKRLLAPFGDAILDQPQCHLCSEMGNTCTCSYISCENCGEWYHGDAFGLNEKNISCIIGFRCHVCRQSTPPVCPHASSRRTNGCHSLESENDGIKLSEEATYGFPLPTEANQLKGSFSSEDPKISASTNGFVETREHFHNALNSDESSLSVSMFEADNGTNVKVNTDAIDRSNKGLEQDLSPSFDEDLP
ncbi:hypothetical protein K2173_016452 [Erythroxylum novogranatense]|uniref:Uncharacterized protein n=1 Tax=Erythroxylum novogranatense TaxID=1862640 RepID=A0AAV8SG96_9ROSI|nr:hypothetical protein K2173_016452 [Erythroxylum novogranatense]